MVLTIDVGNSNIKFVFFENGMIARTHRVETVRSFTKDDFLNKLPFYFEEAGIAVSDIEGGIISSVVPSVSHALLPAVEYVTGKHFFMLGRDVETDLVFEMDNPSTIGQDLIADTVGALSICDPPVIIFDTGTATTMNVVDQRGVYIGGLIIPGLQISLDALCSRAAQLPPIEVKDPRSFIAKNTVDSMRSGLIYGHAAMIDDLIRRTERELGVPCTAVATGGLMALIIDHCDHRIMYRPNLVCDGLYLLYQRSKARFIENIYPAENDSRMTSESDTDSKVWKHD